MESDNNQSTQLTSSTSASTLKPSITTTTSNSNSSKISSVDSSKLTFGPAWLRQLSSGDTNKTQLPPSPGLTFQLAKHRYSREEMLAIFENIENTLNLPRNLQDFDDLCTKSIKKPILLTQPSQEEQVY